MKKNKPLDGNLISWKLVIDKENRIITEVSCLPDEDIDKLFDFPEKETIKFLIRNAKKTLEPLHEELQSKVIV
jgi:hypothetical protein|tara:strand:+ start:37 stop:255 length:219 start_codon:yes stop_codon:yes gene_type:complete